MHDEPTQSSLDALNGLSQKHEKHGPKILAENVETFNI